MKIDFSNVPIPPKNLNITSGEVYSASLKNRNVQAWIVFNVYNDLIVSIGVNNLGEFIVAETFSIDNFISFTDKKIGSVNLNNINLIVTNN